MGIDLVEFWTTFGLCNFSFDGACLALLVVDDGANNDSNESFLVCVVDWLDGFVENISSESFVRAAAGLFELLLKSDSNGSTAGWAVVVGFARKKLNSYQWRIS